MTDPTAEPSQRDQIARALAEKFTSDHQPNPKFDRKREAAWFDAGNPDEEPANSAYMPVPMAERMRRDLMVTFTAFDYERSIRPVRIPEVVEVVLAVRDAEMEQLRADVEFAERYGRRAHTAWLSASRRAHEYRQAAAAEGDLADEAARERDAARAELAGLRERAVDWRSQLAALQSLGIIAHFEGDDEPAEQLGAAPEPATPPTDRIDQVLNEGGIW